MTSGTERSRTAKHGGVADHYCTGDDCWNCERRISQAEYERDCYGDDDYPEYYDGT